MVSNRLVENEKKLKRRELSENILRVIGAGLFISGSIVAPNLPIAVYTIVKGVQKFRKDSVPEKKIRRSIQALEKRRVIRFKRTGDIMYVVVNDGYYEQILKYSISEILNFKRDSQTWDGKWRVIFFDVPEVQRNKRHQLRRLLKKLGFFEYQKSIYVFPYECLKEVDLIRKIVEGGIYIKYAVAEKLEDDGKMRAFFNV